ncbi:hypothetical protein [Janthinobacterium sp. LB3P118]|uniref:hypothetical protein n=1 Tax=Janthinobacterium sp. LB3P118 TaxID=3424195 RepID=UPI003F205D8D
MAVYSYSCQRGLAHHAVVDDSLAQPQWLKRWRKLGEPGFRFINGRNGQPRSLEPRQFGGLPGALRAQISNFLSK